MCPPATKVCSIPSQRNSVEERNSASAWVAEVRAGSEPWTAGRGHLPIHLLPRSIPQWRLLRRIRPPSRDRGAHAPARARHRTHSRHCGTHTLAKPRQHLWVNDSGCGFIETTVSAYSPEHMDATPIGPCIHRLQLNVQSVCEWRPAHKTSWAIRASNQRMGLVEALRVWAA
jgi:hypothetical protein